MRYPTPLVRSGRVYEDYYCHQVGHGLPVFIGGSHTGRGLGNLLGGIGRTLIPLLKSGGKALLKEGAKTGLQVAQDVMSGKKLKTAVTQRTRQAGNRLFTQALGHVTQAAPPGEPKKKRIKSSHPRRVSQKTHKKRRQPRAAVSRDIFG